MCVCVCVRESLSIILFNLSSPPRIAVLTAGYKGLFHNCKNKVHVLERDTVMAARNQ